jgi:murein L,D-transpeptidase YafK
LSLLLFTAVSGAFSRAFSVVFPAPFSGLTADLSCGKRSLMGLSLCLFMFAEMPASADPAPPLAGAMASAIISPMSEPGLPAGLLFENMQIPYLFWVELEAGKLHVLERKAPGSYVRLTTRPISIGKNGIGKQVEGDLRTPVGVYQFTSFLADARLDDYYGAGAYPVNFPNSWDRLQQRSGHGIWLHGLPKGVDSRPPRDSEGCVIIDNPSFTALSEFVAPGESLVVLSRSMTWLAPGSAQAAGDIVEAIEGWRLAWEANKHDDYLAHYHADFSDSRRGLAEWSAYKRRVNRFKKSINVSLSQMSVVEYPGEENLVAVRFYQNYSSSNYQWRGWKQLLWRRDDVGVWRILYEGNG